VLMGSDGWSAEKIEGGHCMSLTVADANEATRVFDALADGGNVFMPLGETFWSLCFGMVSDRFGISWMVTTPEMK
ncbi:MAG: VOC family protein, partial [Verrucomicrobiales bacterium]